MNPNHDPSNGQFTSGTGGGGSADATAKATESSSVAESTNNSVADANINNQNIREGDSNPDNSGQEYQVADAEAKTKTKTSLNDKAVEEKYKKSVSGDKQAERMQDIRNTRSCIVDNFDSIPESLRAGLHLNLNFRAYENDVVIAEANQLCSVIEFLAPREGKNGMDAANKDWLAPRDVKTANLKQCVSAGRKITGMVGKYMGDTEPVTRVTEDNISTFPSGCALATFKSDNTYGKSATGTRQHVLINMGYGLEYNEKTKKLSQFIIAVDQYEPPVYDNNGNEIKYEGNLDGRLDYRKYYVDSLVKNGYHSFRIK